MDNEQVRFSLFIKHPSPDIQNHPEYMKGREVTNVTLAMRDLRGEEFEKIVPQRIRNYFNDALVHRGHTLARIGEGF